VKAGGVLLVVGGEDAYNQIGEWWNRDGFAGPTDHLLRACGAPVEVPQRAVRNGATRFQEVLKAEGPLRAHENRKVYRLPVGEHVKEGKPLLVRFTDLYPQDGWGPWLKRVRVLSGDRVRADFTAGTVGERPFLAEDVSSQAEKSARYADGDASFTYRFGNLGPDAVLELEMANQFQVSVSGDAGAGVPLQPAAVGLPQVRVAASYPLVSYPLSGAEPLYRVQGEETAPAWAASSGAGAVIYCGVPAAFGAESTQGGELVRALVKQACARARLPYAEGPITARRGPYVIAHSLGQTVQLKGRYVDLFRPDLPLVENPQLPYRLPGFYKEVKLTSRVPVLLHGSNRARVAEGAALRTRLLLEGPRDTQGVLRIYAAGMSLTATEAVGPGGQPVAVEARAEGPTVVVRYPQNPAGINLTLRWARPEARLTK